MPVCGSWFTSRFCGNVSPARVRQLWRPRLSVDARYPPRSTRRLRRLAQMGGIPITKAHPHMLRHTFVATMLDAGVDLRDVKIAARHADTRATMRYDRARQNLDRHPNYILTAYMASGT